MKTTKRFDRTISKLYPAFHNGTLDAMDCKKCAVGNMCNGDSSWKHNGFITDTGYSPIELMWVEMIFMFGRIPENCHPDKIISGHEKWRPDDWDASEITNNKDIQFKALCAVIEYLCELDNIPNVMDYTCLFETKEDGTPKHELCTN
jgi:hypothetical protein